ncbi:MAG: hypothetical protein JW955_07760 [Sedimentisphaerales bacterium]|nr:hypothetical protein [Sedimentisphaerales bacterium]
MAQIILSGHELISLLQANAQIPPQILDIAAEEGEIRLKVRTDWPILKSIRVGMRFAGFDNGCLVLQLATNRLTDKFNWLVDRMIEPLQLEEHGGRWEYPRLYIDVNRMIRRRVRGMTVENIVFRDGAFHITTAHARVCGGNGEPQTRQDIEPPDASTA